MTVMMAALVLAGGVALSQTPPEGQDVPPDVRPKEGQVIPGEYAA